MGTWLENRVLWVTMTLRDISATHPLVYNSAALPALASAQFCTTSSTCLGIWCWIAFKSWTSPARSVSISGKGLSYTQPDTCRLPLTLPRPPAIAYTITAHQSCFTRRSNVPLSPAHFQLPLPLADAFIIASFLHADHGHHDQLLKMNDILKPEKRTSLPLTGSLGSRHLFVVAAVSLF